jgi:predicted transcriptional regulator
MSATLRWHGIMGTTDTTGTTRGFRIMATSEQPKSMTLRLSQAEHEALLLLSQSENASMQNIVKQAIREYLDQHPINESTLQAHGKAIMARYGAVMQRLAE